MTTPSPANPATSPSSKPPCKPPSKQAQSVIFFGAGKPPIVQSSLAAAFDLKNMSESAKPWGRFYNEYRYVKPELKGDALTKSAHASYQQIKKDGFKDQKGTAATDFWVTENYEN